MYADGLLLERVQIASLAIPVDLSGAANGATVGDWINVSGFHRFAVKFVKSIGTAGDDPTLTIVQATSSAGAGSKSLPFTVIYRKETATSGGLKTGTTTGQWTRTTQASANTYTNDTSAESELTWVVEFNTAQLDVDNGFKFVNATVADVGTNAQLGTLELICFDPRDGTSAATMIDVRS